MIESAQQFVALRYSDDLTQQAIASHDEAPLWVWRDVIATYPELTEWVIHNKSVPIEILRESVVNPDPSIRMAVARKRKLDDELFAILTSDSDPDVRATLARNKMASEEIILKLLKDESSHVRDSAAQEVVWRKAHSNWAG